MEVKSSEIPGRTFDKQKITSSPPPIHHTRNGDTSTIQLGSKDPWKVLYLQMIPNLEQVVTSVPGSQFNPLSLTQVERVPKPSLCSQTRGRPRSTTKTRTKSLCDSNTTNGTQIYSLEVGSLNEIKGPTPSTLGSGGDASERDESREERESTNGIPRPTFGKNQRPTGFPVPLRTNRSFFGHLDRKQNVRKPCTNVVS